MVAGETIVVLRWQRRDDLAVVDDPGMVVVGTALDVEVVQADGEFVARANAPGKGGCNAALFLLGAVVVGVVDHGVDAQCGVLAGLEVEIALGAVELARAQGVGDFMLIDQQRCLVDLVDHATRGALAEQHGGRALEHFDAVVVEGVALVERSVLHAVDVDVAGLAQRKAAQAHIFLAGLAGLERDARGGAQHFAEIVLVAVVHQTFGEHRDRLRDVLDVLLALADRGLLDQQRVLALHFGGFAHGDRAHGGFGRLGPAANGGRQQHCSQGQQGFVGGGRREGDGAGFGSRHGRGFLQDKCSGNGIGLSGRATWFLDRRAGFLDVGRRSAGRSES